MDNVVFYNIASGAIGSVIGAAIVALASRGWKTISSPKASAERWQKELEYWRTGEIGKRQAIANEYLFRILRYLFIGSILWIFPEIVDPFGLSMLFRLYVRTISLCGGLFFFFMGLGNILRYAKLRASYDPLDL